MTLITEKTAYSHPSFQWAAINDHLHGTGGPYQDHFGPQINEA
jgi:hypothetical protein